MEFFQIEVTKREETGKGPIRRLRRAGNVPGVIYGLGKPNLPISIPTPALTQFFQSHSHLVELTMAGKARQAIVREVQVNPLTDAILHVDLQRVEEGAEIEDHVRLIWKGTATGATKGGVFQSLAEALHIRSTPKDLPAEFTIDVSEMELGDSVRAGDVPMPKGVTLLSPEDMMLAQVAAPKLTAEDEAEDEVEEGAEAEAAGADEGGDDA